MDPGLKGGGGETPRDVKKEVLYHAMYSAQPQFKDFRGYDGFPRRMLESDQDWLSRKYSDIADSMPSESDDDWARYMEPVLTYILGSETLIPSRETFSFLAHDYDDKRNGTDIVFGVENNKTNENMVFSVDVATGTLLKNIQNKFQNSIDKHSGTSYVKYCMHKDQRWREPEAPHFILGMSPASQDKTVDKIIVTNGELKGREKDPDSDFLILSEIREEIYMQLAILRNGPKTDAAERQMERLDNLIPAINTGLYQSLGINSKDYPTKEERTQAFNKLYIMKSNELMRKDDVYKNIVYEAKRRRNLARGKTGMDGFTKTAS